MPRRKTPFVEDHYYHIYNRGNNRGAIFFKPENYLFFLRRWRKYVFPFVEVIAYCLMPTHYHFLVRIRKTKSSEVLKTSELSNAMQKFSISYTKAINKRFDRVGSLFQGAFQAKPVKSNTHLLHLCRYIHANPVKDGIVATLDDWPYSNYPEWIGTRAGTLVDKAFIRDYFQSPDNYVAFVMDYLKTRDLPDEIKGYLSDVE